ncbi:MAG: patatin-like phospholipase family protein [Clostridia bacterium]|nr:patatin-like phospholipase family protein [Clostridia bacterium]
MKKLGLALGAGGARGVAHIGFLQALEDNNIKPYCIAGSSMGSVVGSCYALGFAPEYMLKIVKALKMRDILDLAPNALFSGTILKSKKMAAILHRFMGKTQIEDLPMPFSCVGTDIISGNKVVFDQGELATAVQASSSIPMVFAPVDYDNMLVADGCMVCRVPVKEAKDLGCDVVVAVDVMGELSEMEELKGLVNYFARLLEIYDCEVAKHNREKNPADFYLCPELGDMSPYKINKDSMQIAYDQGYESAMSIMSELKEALKG